MLKILIKDKIDSLVAEELKKGGFLVQEGDNRLESIFQEVQQNEILIVRSATRVTKEVIDAALANRFT